LIVIEAETRAGGTFAAQILGSEPDGERGLKRRAAGVAAAGLQIEHRQ